MDGGRHQNVFANDGFLYTTRWTKNNTRYLVCQSNRQLGCTATGKMTVGDVDGAGVAQFVLLNARHNHPRRDDQIEGIEFRKELRAACITDRGTLKTIYEQTATRNVNGAVYVPFNSIRSSMLRWRQLTTPNIPGSLVELADIFQLGLVTANEDHAVIFGNQEFIVNFTDSQCTFIDGTFKSVPRRPTFGQILTVFASCMDHAFPIIHVFMERRTKALYDAVFEYLSLTFPHFVNQNVVTDFEVALVESLKAAYPQAMLHGCFFHFCQAILRKAKALGIVRQMEGHARGKIFLRKYYALALLPAEMIEPSLTLLQEDVEFGATFRDLNDYIRRHWIGRVTPEHFSVFRQRHRTNNVMESYHRRLNSKLVRHPGVWDLIGTLIGIQNTASLELAQLEREPDRVFRNAKKNDLFNSKLNGAWQKLSDGRFTAKDFLRQAVHFVEGLDRELHDWNANIADNEEEPVLAFIAPLQIPTLVPIAPLHIPTLVPIAPLHIPTLVPIAPLHIPTLVPIAPLHIPTLVPIAPLHIPTLVPIAPLHIPIVQPPVPIAFPSLIPFSSSLAPIALNNPPLLPRLPYPAILIEPPPLIYFQPEFPAIPSHPPTNSLLPPPSLSPLPPIPSPPPNPLLLPSSSPPPSPLPPSIPSTPPSPTPSSNHSPPPSPLPPSISSPPPSPTPSSNHSPPPSPLIPQVRSPSPPLNQDEFEGDEGELPIYNFPPIPAEVAALFAQLGDDEDPIVVHNPIVRRWEPTSASRLFNEDTMPAMLRCPVCYNSEIRYVVECGHAFCPGCMDRLFNAEAATCGICRTELNRDPIPLFLVTAQDVAPYYYGKN